MRGGGTLITNRLFCVMSGMTSNYPKINCRLHLIVLLVAGLFVYDRVSLYYRPLS